MESQLRLYRLLITSLVVLNIGMLAAMFFLHRPRPERPEQVLRKELNLTDGQMDQYRLLIKEHRSEVEPLHDQMRDLREKLFAYSTMDDGTARNLVSEIGNLQGLLNLSTYRHFQKVRALCNEKQKERFDAVILEAMRGMEPPRPDRHP